MTDPDGLDEYARAYPQLENDTIPPLVERWLAKRRFATILDAGCGEGALVRALVKSGHVAGRLLACDGSAVRLARLADIGEPVTTFVDDVEELRNVETGAVDFVISSQVIEHVDDARMLKTLARVTEKGGIVYLSTVQKSWYAWYFHRSEGGWALDPTHRREYRSDDELLALVDADDFVVRENVKSPVRYPAPDFLLRRMGRVPFVRTLTWLQRMRKVRVRIPGYFVWELVLERR